jgi:DNA-binding transcriptional MerR regulator
MTAAAAAKTAERRLLTIREAAAETGVTAHTLRYYERIGLARPVSRAKSGHRRYAPDDVRWVVFLRRLHDTGIPIRRMLEYARLARKGDAGAAARRALLLEHQREIQSRLAQLTSTLDVIERKLALYDTGSK